MGIFGTIGRVLFGGKKKTTSAKSSGTTDVDPYAPTIGPINDFLAASGSLYGPGGAPQISDYERQGYDNLSNVVGAGSIAVDPAIAENNKTLHGDYLSPDTNPYLKDIATRISGIAGANTNATFGGRGRSSGGLAGYYAGKAVGDSLTDLYGQNYAAERGRMGSAVGVAPSLEAGRYLGPQAQISAGQNISARPFDINQQYGGILAQIAGLGQQGSTTGQQQNYKATGGIISKIGNSFLNKLFPGG